MRGLPAALAGRAPSAETGRPGQLQHIPPAQAPLGALGEDLAGGDITGRRLGRHRGSLLKPTEQRGARHALQSPDF
jgi:hypothetical protein